MENHNSQIIYLKTSKVPETCQACVGHIASPQNAAPIAMIQAGGCENV